MTLPVFKVGDRIVLRYTNKTRTNELHESEKRYGTLVREYGGGYEAWWMRWDGWSQDDACYTWQLDYFEFQYNPFDQNDLEEDI